MSAPGAHQHAQQQAAAQGGQEGQDEDSYEYSYDSQEDDEEDEMPWVLWFCSMKGNEFFCEVDEDYIQDDFNLTGLSLMVPFFEHAVEMILDLESPDEERLTDDQRRLAESSAETLYGLIHARFILTPRGLKLMEEKYKVGAFGRCPRVSCGGQPVLPVGQSDVVRESSVKLYCPRCRELYFPRSSRHKALDGAFWGTTFPHLLLMTLHDGPPPIEPPAAAYVPRIFGFRVRKPDDAANSAPLALTQRHTRPGAAAAGQQQQQKHTDPNPVVQQ
jgi:casein kinase II subunit beta